MKNIIVKLAKAKDEIKHTKVKKEGKNTFSNYEYFTPAQIEQLVYDASQKNNLLTKFDLVRTELGVTGLLTVIDLDSAEQLTFEMATAIPEIKATNIAQQLGGCVTYTERYLKMSAFGITDNSLDFDTTENTKKQNETKEYRQNAPEQKLHNGYNYQDKINDCKTQEELKQVWESIPVARKPEFEEVKNLQKAMLSK